MDMTAEDFAAIFAEMMGEMLGGLSIGEMLAGLDEDDVAAMPPFPFPEKLFPPGTFPKGMRFSSDFNLPPAVQEMLEKARRNTDVNRDVHASTALYSMRLRSRDDLC